MSNTKLTALAIIAVITTTLAVWLSTSKQTPTSDPTKVKYLIGNIEPSLIDAIVIGDGNETVNIKHSGKRFVVKNKDNYPAEITEINDLIRTCVDIKISELYTDSPDNHKDLGVLQENASSQVKFLKADGTLLTGVIVGNTKQGGKGTYIRQSGKNEVYVTLDTPRVRSAAMDYIDQEITSTISKEAVDSVEITQASGKYTLTVNDQGRILPDQMQEDKILKDAEVEKVFTALSSLRFTDVSKDTKNLNFNKIYVCRLADQTVYSVFLVDKDDKTYITCGAQYTGQLPANAGEFSTQEELKEKEAKYLARDNAVEFSAKHSGWIYEISSNSAQSLTKSLDDLFEEPEKPETTDDPNTPAPPADIPDPNTTM